MECTGKSVDNWNFGMGWLMLKMTLYFWELGICPRVLIYQNCLEKV